MFAFAISYVVFHFSGTYHVRKASESRRAKLSEEQDRILGIASTKPTLQKLQGESEEPEKEVDTKEALQWLKDTAWHFTAFMPNSDIYLQRRWEEVEAVVKSGGKDLDGRILGIAKECAEEMKKEARNGAIGWYIGRTSWDIVRKYVDKIAALGEELNIKKSDVVESVKDEKKPATKKGWW
jgi:hypothetical protein